MYRIDVYNTVRRQHLWHNLVMDTLSGWITLVKLPQLAIVLFSGS